MIDLSPAQAVDRITALLAAHKIVVALGWATGGTVLAETVPA